MEIKYEDGILTVTGAECKEGVYRRIRRLLTGDKPPPAKYCIVRAFVASNPWSTTDEINEFLVGRGYRPISDDYMKSLSSCRHFYDHHIQDDGRTGWAVRDLAVPSRLAREWKDYVPPPFPY